MIVISACWYPTKLCPPVANTNGQKGRTSASTILIDLSTLPKQLDPEKWWQREIGRWSGFLLGILRLMSREHIPSRNFADGSHLLPRDMLVSGKVTAKDVKIGRFGLRSKNPKSLTKLVPFEKNTGQIENQIGSFFQIGEKMWKQKTRRSCFTFCGQTTEKSVRAKTL